MQERHFSAKRPSFLSYRKALKTTLLLLALGSAAIVHAQDLGLEWVKGMGASNSDMGLGLTVSDSGFIYATGYYTNDIDFGSGSNAITLKGNGKADIFLSKQDAAGNFLWVKSLGGAARDWGRSVATDKSGNSYITGLFNDTADFNPGSGSNTLISNGSSDIFVTKLDAQGNFVWAKHFGGTGDDDGNGITVDAAGNTYITGTFQGSMQMGSTTLTAQASTYIFIAKLDASGNVVWAKSYGAAGTHIGHSGMAITTDNAGHVYATGSFMETVDFNPGGTAANLTSNGAQDIFLLKLKDNGDYVWAKSMGGSSTDQGQGITIDNKGNICLTGYFSDNISIPRAIPLSPLHLSSNGIWDTFIAKFDANGTLLWGKGIGGTNGDEGQGIITDTADNIYTVGWFMGNVDFNPGTSNGFFLNTGKTQNMFILKLDAAGNFNWAKMPRGYGVIPGGSLSSTTGMGIGVDRSGSVYTAGFYQGTVDFDPGPDSLKLTAPGNLPNIFVLKLSCTDTSLTSVKVSTCEGSYTYDGEVYNETGVYSRTLINASGCDSTVVLDLTIYNMPPAHINVNGFKLGTTATYSSYQWLINGNIIPGATDSTYVVTQNGTYGVAVASSDGCKDTAYYEVTNYTGIQNIPALARSIRVYPNPAVNMVNIQSPIHIQATLLDVTGKEIYHINDARSISVKGLAAGIYLLRISDRSGMVIKVEKVVKQAE